MARPLFVLVLLFSVVILIGGVHWPGGGFVGGLVVAIAFALRAVALGLEDARSALRVPSRIVEVVGLAILIAAALAGWLVGDFLTMLHLEAAASPALEAFLGTGFLFQVGVFVHVAGVAITILFHLMEREEA